MKLTTKLIPLALMMFVAVASAVNSLGQTQTGNDNARRASSQPRLGLEENSVSPAESTSPTPDFAKAIPVTAVTEVTASKSERAPSSNSSKPAPASSSDEW